MEDELILKKEDSIWTLTINRPEKRNTVYPALLSRIRQVIADIEADSTARVLILRGAGDKVFCGGYDMALFGKEIAYQPAGDPGIKQVLEAIMGCARPVVAMANGDCLGAGAIFVSAGDIRVASAHARFSYPAARRGIIPSYWVVSYYCDLLGVSNYKEMVMLGRYFDAKRARELGLVHFVVPQEELVTFTYGIANEIAENAPLTIKAAKAIIYNRTVARLNREEIPQELESLLMALSEKEHDRKEGIQAFFQKRKPRFTGE